LWRACYGDRPYFDACAGARWTSRDDSGFSDFVHGVTMGKKGHGMVKETNGFFEGWQKNSLNTMQKETEQALTFT
jgi:hypothetical protein